VFQDFRPIPALSVEGNIRLSALNSTGLDTAKSLQLSAASTAVSGGSLGSTSPGGDTSPCLRGIYAFAGGNHG
jgi:hypothetical protein